MKTSVLGTTVGQRELKMDFFGNVDKPFADLFLFAGVHGDEIEGIVIGQRYAEWCRVNEARLVTDGLRIAVLAQANPDGIAANSRLNSRGVDLNRNMETKDWSPVARTPRYEPGPAPFSEIESRTLAAAVELLRPRLIISLHTFEPQININGPAEVWGETLSRITGYPMNTDIGYPTPGSFGTWAGLERGIPTITFEIRRDLPRDSEEWDLCFKALLNVTLPREALLPDEVAETA